MVKRLLIGLIFTLGISISGCSNPSKTYEQAKTAMSEEKWDEAIGLFDTISDYEDSKKLSQDCKIEKEKHEKADYDFLDTMTEAVMTRYKKSQNDESLEICISYDLTTLSKYKEAEFYDKELQKLALEYISGVELQKESLTTELGQRQMKNYEGKVKRFNALKSLTDNYGLLKDNVDYQVNYYNEADKLSQEYEAFKEIEATLQDIFATAEPVDYSTARVTYNNTTNHNFDMFIYFTFKNEAGEILTSTEEYYKIHAQSTNKLDFYVPEDTFSWDYYTEEYIFQ